MANEILTVKYNELDTIIPTLTAGTYDLTVDCEGVSDSEFIGDTYSPSLFGQKLKASPENVYFNLVPTNINGNATLMFKALYEIMVDGLN